MHELRISFLSSPNNNNNTVISIALFTDRPRALTTSDVCSTKKFSFEAAFEKTSVTDMMEIVWKTVPCSRSSVREAALSELGSAPRLGVSVLEDLRPGRLLERATV